MNFSLRTLLAITGLLIFYESDLEGGVDAFLPRFPESLMSKPEFYLLTSEYSGKIVGGEDCQPGTVPHQVSIQSKGSHFCGASIISTRCVLTAAHCCAAIRNPGTVTIMGGTMLLNASDAKNFNIDKIKIHPSYSPHTMKYDLAIIKTADAMDIESNPSIMQKVEIADKQLSPKTIVTTSGYGVTSEGANSISKSCKCVDVYTVSNEECNDAYEGKIYDGMVCASAQGKDSCQGDSGGPLYIKEADVITQYGIVSWGRGCAQDAYPGVYTDTFYHAEWIKTTTKELCGEELRS